MNWIETAKSLGIFTVASSCISAIIVLIFRNYFNNSMAMKLEQFKNGLNLKVEEFKSELKKSVDVHQMKFAKLHERRIELIPLLYKELVEIETAMINETIIKGNQNKSDEEEQLCEEVASHLSEFIKIYRINKFCFNENTCKLIDELIDSENL